LNIRLQKYKKNRLLGMNQYNAARAAGFSEATAKVHTKELEERAKIADVLERQGLTDNVLVSKHKELLDAQKVILIDGKPLVVEKGSATIPEFQIQIKALELAYKLKKQLSDNPIIDNSSHTHLSIAWNKNGRETDKDRLLSSLSPIRHTRAPSEIQSGGNGEKMGKDNISG
jgi:hypothetical protein